MTPFPVAIFLHTYLLFDVSLYILQTRGGERCKLLEGASSSLPAPLDFVRTAENVIHDLNDVVARMLFLLYKLDKYTTGFVTEIAVFSYFDTKIVVM